MDKWWELKNKYDDLNRQWLGLWEENRHQSDLGRKILEEMNLLLEQMSKEAA